MDSDSEEMSLVLVELKSLADWVISGSANGYVIDPRIWITEAHSLVSTCVDDSISEELPAGVEGFWVEGLESESPATADTAGAPGRVDINVPIGIERRSPAEIMLTASDGSIFDGGKGLSPPGRMD